MFWKTALLCIISTTLAFANPDPKKHDLNRAHDAIAKVVGKTKNSSNAKSSSLSTMLDSLQERINTHLQKMGTSGIPAYAVSIDDDVKQLQALSQELQKLAGSRPALAYSQAVLAKMTSSLAAAASESDKRAILQAAWESIGQVVFLSETNPAKAKAVVDPSALDTTAQKIRQACQDQLQQLVAMCHVYQTTQQNCGVQDAGSCLSMYEPLVIAQVLLTTSGKLNIGMVSLVKEAFIPAKAPLEYQVGMDHVLSSMNSSWQAIFDTIVKPAAQNSTSEALVRAELLLSPQDQITDLDAKEVALKGLLSQLNQGSTGDCFAVAWAIKKHDDYLTQSLSDYQELIQNGYLTRKVNGVDDQFFFKTTLADDDLEGQIQLASNGAVGINGGMIWDVGGIVAACREIGLENLQSHTKAALAPLFKNGTTTIQTTPLDIIKAFAAYANPKLNQTNLLNRGKYAFSVTQNRLLRAWETALAGMAEATKGDYVRDDVISSVHTALNDAWNAIQTHLPQTEQHLVPQLQNAFETALNQTNRFVYNADIPLAQVSSDGSSHSGGFELYRRSAAAPKTMGTRVATPDDFKHYLVDMLHYATATLASSSPADAAALNQISNAIAPYLTNNDVLRAIFFAFDPDNKKDPHPLLDYANLTNTPMTSLVGDDPYAVELIDTGVPFLPDVKTITPGNPYDLAKWILDLAAWKEQTQHYLEDGNPDELDPAGTPQHAFNIAFDNADIKAFVSSGEASDQWIQEKIIQPNMAIAQGLMDDASKQNFTDYVMQWVKANVDASNPVIDNYQQALNQASQQQLTVQNYACSLLNTLTTELQADDNTAKEIAIVFDSILLQSLPAQSIQSIDQTSLSFALTNWNQGDENLYFCVFFNPRTQALSFGTITEDKSQLNVMDENQWVDNQTWEVVPIEEPIPAVSLPPPPPPAPQPLPPTRKPLPPAPKATKTVKPVPVDI